MEANTVVTNVQVTNVLVTNVRQLVFNISEEQPWCETVGHYGGQYGGHKRPGHKRPGHKRPATSF